MSPLHSDFESTTMLPQDDFNRELLDNVHPADWINPTPTARYQMVVIGAGPAGLVTAAIGAAIGAKVALIEKRWMGGDCLNVGCVPSKGVIAASRVWADARRANAFGLTLPDGLKTDFGAVMARMRKLRARISQNDSAHRFKKMGIDVFFGEGHFTGSNTIEVDGKVLNFKKAAICTGTRAHIPLIPGLAQVGYLTNETLFTLTDLPPKMAVIGAGPIGCEMAQSFARFGSAIALFVKGDHILPREDQDAARWVYAQMKKDGVAFIFNANMIRVSSSGKEKVIHYEEDKIEKTCVVDEIFVAAGRAPNVEGLGMEKAGVHYHDKTGVVVNAFLQTTNPSIYAAGDICFPYQFTHVADKMAGILIQNALLPHPFGLGLASTDSMIIPWCTYTSPEIAHVGLTEAKAIARGIPVESFTCECSDVDRAILDGEEEGFLRVHLRKGTDQILGATWVAARAGEMISEITLAMTAKIGLHTILNAIHPYPTQAEMIRKVALQWKKSTFTAKKQKLLTKWFSMNR
ncbi:MAG: mercuric reductase [Nitrospirota bacterium]